MGVLRIKDNVDELLEKDPYELFTLEEPHQVARRMRPELFGAAFIGVVVAFGVALFTFLDAQQTGKDAGDAPFAYFEIKAIDPEGHPVAGAVVKDGDKSLGVTDSFGEWRRFMRVKLGSTVALTLVKRAGEAQLTAVKNIAVPAALPETGDLELLGSVQLARGAAKGVPVSRRSTATESASASDSAVDADATAVSASAPAAASGAAPTSIWFVATPTARPAVLEVVESLKQRARELGVVVAPEAAMRVSVGDVLVARKTEEKAERRLLQVDARLLDGVGDQRLFTYLRDHQETALKTARDILWAATMHLGVRHPVSPDGTTVVPGATPALWALTPGRTVVDADGQVHTAVAGAAGLSVMPPVACGAGACAVSTPSSADRSPVNGWERRKARVFGIAPGADVYVAGYEARRVDAETLEFWGPAEHGVNVTVIQGGRLVHRSRLEPGAMTIAVPTKKVSRLDTTTL